MSLLRYEASNLYPINNESLTVSDSVQYKDNLLLVPEEGNKHAYLVQDEDNSLNVNLIIDEDALNYYDELVVGNSKNHSLLYSGNVLAYEADYSFIYDAQNQYYVASLETTVPVDNLHQYDAVFSFNNIEYTISGVCFMPGYQVSSTKTILYTLELNPPTFNYTVYIEISEENNVTYLNCWYYNPNDLGDIDSHIKLYETGKLSTPTVYYRKFEFSDYGQSEGFMGLQTTYPSLANIIDPTKYYIVELMRNQDDSTMIQIDNNIKFIDSSELPGSVLLYHGELEEGGNTLLPPSNKDPVAIWTNNEGGNEYDYYWIQDTYEQSQELYVRIKLIGDDPQPIYEGDYWNFNVAYPQGATRWVYTSGSQYRGLDGIDGSCNYDIIIGDLKFSNIQLTIEDPDPTSFHMTYGSYPPTPENPLYIDSYVASGDWYTEVSFYSSSYLGSSLSDITIQIYPAKEQSRAISLRTESPKIKQYFYDRYLISQLEKDEDTGNYILPIDLTKYESETMYCYLAKRNDAYQYMLSKPCKFYIIKRSQIPIPSDEAYGKFIRIDQPFCYGGSWDDEDKIDLIGSVNINIQDYELNSCVSSGAPTINELTGYGSSFNLLETTDFPCYRSLVLYKHKASNQFFYYAFPSPSSYVKFSGNYPFKIEYAESDYDISYASSTDRSIWKIMTSVAYSSTNETRDAPFVYELYLAGWKTQGFLNALRITPVDQGVIDLQIEISGNLAALGDPNDLSLNLDSNYLFAYNDSIYSVSDLQIPSTINCLGMFNQCANLIDTPQIVYVNGVSLQESQFSRMFYQCWSLVDASNLSFPDIQLAQLCYDSMFSNSGVRIPPILRSTHPATLCYQGMFTGAPIKVSSTQDESYTESFRIPYQGTIDSQEYGDITNAMFNQTGGTFQGTPALNTEYFIEIPAVPA